MESVKAITKCNVYVRSLPDAKIRHIEDYVKPSVRQTSDHFVLNVGTNNSKLQVNRKGKIVLQDTLVKIFQGIFD